MTVQDGPNNPWPARLDNWKNFSQKIHERGKAIEARYEDERDTNNMTVGSGTNDVGGRRVNMFFSNTCILKESLFNSLPKPDVKRLHFGEWDNDVARVAALIVQRGLTYEVCNAPHFKMAVESAILDRLVPGFGTVWVEFKQKDTGEEYICVEPVYWADLLWEPGRTWEAATWVGRKLHPTVDKAREKWGDAAVQATSASAASSSSSGGEKEMFAGTTCVLQIWSKDTREVIHMTPEGHVLDRNPDPYRLYDFYPCPRPLIANPPTRKFAPLPDYYIAQDQYNQLDILYSRISLIIQAIRVAGVYDASVNAIGRMLSGTENKLIPVDNWAMFAEKGGAKGVIDWFPVEQVAAVLSHLVQTYEFIKTQLFEVTGMSDIVRGSSNQYETLGAQQIKAQFASVRLDGQQRDVSAFVTQVLEIMSEMMVQLYSQEKLAAIVGSLPQEDQQYIQPAYQLLQDDFLSQCSVSIQADSLTQADWGLEQQQRMQYAQSLSQFLQSALPVAEANPALAPLLMNVIKFITVGFRGSAELEGSLDAAMDRMAQTLQQEEQQPPEPSPEELKVQAEMQLDQQKMQLEMQVKQAEAQLDVQKDRQKMSMDQQKHQMDMQMDMQRHQQQMVFEREKHQQQLEFLREKAALKMEVDVEKAAIDAAETVADDTKED